METKHRQNRDQRNGRYTFDGDLTRMCVCGHTLAQHFHGAPHDCAAHTMAPYPKCDCPKFRQSRKKAKET